MEGQTFWDVIYFTIGRTVKVQHLQEHGSPGCVKHRYVKTVLFPLFLFIFLFLNTKIDIVSDKHICNKVEMASVVESPEKGDWDSLDFGHGHHRWKNAPVWRVE